MNNKVFRDLSYGVYVITTFDSKNNRFTGCVANSCIQISDDPKSIIVSLNHQNYTNQCINEIKKFAVSILPENVDLSLIGNFGFASGRDKNKFDGIKYMEVEGMPVLADACSYLVCEVSDIMETNTHSIFLGNVLEGEQLNNYKPLTYAKYHELKNKEQNDAPKSQTPKYKCSICGYVYDGEIPFEELPDDWQCPICHVGKDKFVLVQ